MKTKQAFKLLTIIFVMNFLFASAGCGGRQTPESTVKNYVSSLDKGRCKRAYQMVYLATREYDPRYSSYKEFKLSVCDSVDKKYDRLRVFRIDDVIGGGNEVVVNFRIIFDPKSLPHKSKRPVSFEMKKSGRKWYIKGPSLEI